MTVTYHRLTSYRADRHWLIPVDDPRVVATFLPLDPEHCPAEFKTYPVDLARKPPPTELSWLLRHSAAVLRRANRGGRTTYYRATPSAGNRHPVELYVCADDGVWHYHPLTHELCRIGPPPDGVGLAIVLTGIPWRTCWKYAERGYRHVWWDAGSLAAQLHAVAAERDIDVTVRLAFVDDEVARLVGADGRHEVPLAILTMDDAVVPTAKATATPGDIGPIGTVFPLIDAAHQAGALHTATDVTAWTRIRRGTARATTHAAATTANRGSTRHFTQNPIAAMAARRILAATETRPTWDAGPWPLTTRVLVQSVDGKPTGLYEPNLDPVCLQETRATATALCGGQNAAAEAALTIYELADLDELPDDRSYRAIQFAAGFAIGSLYLAATAEGLGATGLGITDELVADTLATSRLGMVAAAVGIPASASKAARTERGDTTSSQASSG